MLFRLNQMNSLFKLRHTRFRDLDVLTHEYFNYKVNIGRTMAVEHFRLFYKARPAFFIETLLGFIITFELNACFAQIFVIYLQ